MTILTGEGCNNFIVEFNPDRPDDPEEGETGFPGIPQPSAN
jgi:hypothetical protein